jgi:hypothetical protein
MMGRSSALSDSVGFNFGVSLISSILTQLTLEALYLLPGDPIKRTVRSEIVDRRKSDRDLEDDSIKL